MIRAFTFVVLCSLYTSLSVGGAEPDWKLKPLPYNHPGLQVDLGVGLWAWPMPMDYDGDGDLDLLVGCPDKPSNGVFFFENPTQDPSVKMPVFKPAVKLGKASHYMMVSHVDGEPIIMQPAKEFRRDPKSGKFDFGKPQRIYSREKPELDAAGRTRGNMWRYVDYDGDGDHDIIIGIGDWTDLGWDHAYDNNGTWRNGPLHGYVYLITNEGSDQEPRYSETQERLHAAGGAIDVYGWPCPNFADFDGDGDLDLICGEFLDGFTYFENIGSRSVPEYAAGQKLADDLGNPLRMDLQMITPTAVDWDSDGDIDLIVGDEDGRVAFVENTGQLRRRTPVFTAPQYFRQEADTLKFGALSTPYVYDWDNDGDEDIICGNTAGSVAVFENLGDTADGLPKWAEPQLLNVSTADGSTEPFRVMAGESGSIQGPCEAKWGYTTLSVADWDGDGDGDIIYNSILSRLGLLINESGTLVEQEFDTGLSESPPAWYWWQTKSSSALTQWRTTPVAIDFDNDQELDLVMLDQAGYLTLRRSGGAAERIFIDENNEPLRLNTGTCGRSGRVKLSVVDWDGDSRLDVLVNSENATWYRNCEDRDGKVVLKKVGNLAKRNVAGHTSSPAVCDFDRDGKPDLLVGSENGRIYHIAHDDCVEFSAEEIAATPAEAEAKTPFPGWVEDEFIYKAGPFPQCHASTICETSRGLVAAWFGGTKEGDEDVCIWTSYHDGLNWSSPIRTADGVQHDGLRYPCWNPVLYQPPGDAPTLLFYKVGPNPRQWWGEMMVSYDRGRTFVERQRLPEGIAGPIRCKPVLLADGKTLLCGSSSEHDGWRVHFEEIQLTDGEINDRWRRTEPINDGKTFSAIQPTILEHPDGRLQVLCRTRQGVVATSESTDQGKTWSKLRATDLPNPNSGIDAVTLADGRYLLVYNAISSGRGELNLAISEDGSTWKPVAVIEKAEGAEFSYPAMIQSGDGKVHVTYTWNRKRIKHVVVDPSQL
ncbi:exo-alpha-sialidase [Allorhodopirellula heiligendammensis]|uniref:FG-GAP repeat protein n=1 Tax=Allorhodopirellula heiligendammensis TaxID=2714739 RepID=A0A5C6BVG6_9BACT|nr:exo-alpha-sialidase [Allorhodopirellula heiligendammensis]TWU16273.1 FG-GAP repeat protein [Allorhodopirellula heiligendammensis]